MIWRELVFRTVFVLSGIQIDGNSTTLVVFQHLDEGVSLP